jgi:hypothetical protein
MSVIDDSNMPRAAPSLTIGGSTERSEGAGFAAGGSLDRIRSHGLDSLPTRHFDFCQHNPLDLMYVKIYMLIQSETQSMDAGALSCQLAGANLMT